MKEGTHLYEINRKGLPICFLGHATDLPIFIRTAFLRIALYGPRVSSMKLAGGSVKMKLLKD
jgi:hypothetical protein